MHVAVGFVIGVGFSGVVVVVRYIGELRGGQSRGRACDIVAGQRQRGCSSLMLLLKAAVGVTAQPLLPAFPGEALVPRRAARSRHRGHRPGPGPVAPRCRALAVGALE